MVEIIFLKIVGLVRRWHLATVEMGPDDARVWRLQDHTNIPPGGVGA